MHDHVDRSGAALVMAMLQDKELPEVFQGPSHDTVRHFIDKAAERNAFLQDAAMAAQTTQDTMKGDHTFKLAALCQNALGTPFTAHHSIMGDSAILLSVVFAKDESIAALKEQHEELKVRHLQRGMLPTPWTSAVHSSSCRSSSPTPRMRLTALLRRPCKTETPLRQLRSLKKDSRRKRIVNKI